MSNDICKIALMIGILLFLSFAMQSVAHSQPRTMGLMLNDTALAYRGYTLLVPNKYSDTYLIDNDGRLVHSWTASTYPPSQSAYILPNGHLLRSCKIPSAINTGGVSGGRIEEYTWGDTLVWFYTYSTDTTLQHHDIRPLPNGNVLMLAVEKKTYAQCIAAGFDSARIPQIRTTGYMLIDMVVEVQPTYPSGGTIVWQWHTWDHLIQGRDSSKANYGNVAAHPELISTAGNGGNLNVFWNHMNCVTYNPQLDQVMVSVRQNSELWIIDHSTTTVQATSHTGGRYGHGGDLLYRWGNPVCYSNGTNANQMLFQQHDTEWITPDCPGAGHITIFNNGQGRNYSSADEITPPIDSLGFYSRGTGAFGPTQTTWSYTATPNTAFYGANISSAQRLPNGNTLILNGPKGTMFEVTTTGQMVWQYISPVTNLGPLYQYDTIPDDTSNVGTKQNLVFRANRYAPTYAGFQGRDLTPGNFIERYTTAVSQPEHELPQSIKLFDCYPNPFNATTEIRFDVPKSTQVSLRVYDMLGRKVAELVNDRVATGTHRVSFDGGKIATGVYIVKLEADGKLAVKKLVLLK